MLYTHGEIPPYPHQPELSCFFNEKLEAHSNLLVDVKISVWSPLRYDDAVRHSVQIAHIHSDGYLPTDRDRKHERRERSYTRRRPHTSLT